MNRILPLLTLLLLATSLTACGVKPQHVDPPDAGAPDTFPRTYPAPHTP